VTRQEDLLTLESLVSINLEKSAISRIKNHAEDIRLSTLGKFAQVLGRKLEVSIK